MAVITQPLRWRRWRLVSGRWSKLASRNKRETGVARFDKLRAIGQAEGGMQRWTSSESLLVSLAELERRIKDSEQRISRFDFSVSRARGRGEDVTLAEQTLSSMRAIHQSYRDHLISVRETLDCLTKVRR